MLRRSVETECWDGVLGRSVETECLQVVLTGSPVRLPEQNDSSRLQSQLSSVRSQQGRDADKHQLLVASLNEQITG